MTGVRRSSCFFFFFNEEFTISVLYKVFLTLSGGGQEQPASRVHLGDLNSIYVADRWNSEQLLEGNPLPSTAYVRLKSCFPEDMHMLKDSYERV